MATETDRDIEAFHAAAAAFWRGEPCPEAGAARNGWLAAAGEAQRQVVADRAYIAHRGQVVAALHEAGAALRAASTKKVTPRERALITSALVMIQSVLPHCGATDTTRSPPSSRGRQHGAEA